MMVLVLILVEGCTDISAFNFDDQANTDDGSCIDVVEGCTDSNASNFNPSANTDDASCIVMVVQIQQHRIIMIC